MRSTEKEISMSADNGIYIGEFPTATDGKEWRVIHAQAIENNAGTARGYRNE